MPFMILSPRLILHLHYLFFQIEESPCVSCSFLESCVKPLIIFIILLCVFSSSTYILSEMKGAEHSNQDAGITMVFSLVPYFFRNNS